MPVPSNYNPKEFESEIYSKWQEAGVGIPEKQEAAQARSKKNTEGKPNKSDTRISDTYTILMPPPNLTGDLHAGHAFQHYLMDTLSRVARQTGQTNLWYPGVDHAGIQLEGVIDKLIKAGEFDEIIKGELESYQRENVKFSPTPLFELDHNEWPKWLKQNAREVWLKLAWTKVEQWRNNQKKQAAVLGDTPDYSRQLFTLDERATRMVMHAFEQYWKDGLIYKGQYMINWSVGLQTALSDFQQDVEWVEQQDPFVTFEYTFLSYQAPLHITLDEQKELFDFLKKHLGKIQVSTVRPETIYGDLAIAIHPAILEKKLGDSPYAKKVYNWLIAKEKEDKLFVNYQLEDDYKPDINNPESVRTMVRLIVDDTVDENFGTGALKITPAHDQIDFDYYKKFTEKGWLQYGYQQAIGRDGKLKSVAGELSGWPVLQGRVGTIKMLISKGYVPVKAEFTQDETQIKIDCKLALEREEFNPIDYSYSEGLKRLRQILGDYADQLQIDWNYTHNVLYCERSKTQVEPLISEEFFLSYHTPAKSKGKTLLEFGREGVAETKFHPADMADRSNSILVSLKDWCISRDLVWGHRIPVWYNTILNPNKKFYSFIDEKKSNSILDGKDTNLIEVSEFKDNLGLIESMCDIIGKEKHQDEDYYNVIFPIENAMKVQDAQPTEPGNWVREEKILDTWFSSCLWPLTTLNFYDYLQGEKNTDFEKFYPTQVLTTGTDILYAWILRMIILSKYWTGKAPFENLVITPTLLDEHGKKMSKSLKNGLDPVDQIEKFSSDALRLALLGGMIPSRNMRMGGTLADKLTEKYRNFGNKLWNVARFLESKSDQN